MPYGIVSLVGLKERSLSRALAVFGLPSAILAFAFAIGYILGIPWLGEQGIGLAFFFFFPAWLIWTGISVLLEKNG